MGFRIAFPLDGGTQDESLLVLVQLVRAKSHHVSYTKGSKIGSLRPSSGADFIFRRLKTEIREQCHFKFEYADRKDRNNGPNEISQDGDSDALACALASAQNLNVKEQDPIISVSCSFNLNHEEPQGLTELILNPVTDESDPSKSTDSLFNKWYISKYHKSLALILHEKDANLLLQKDNEIPKLKINDISQLSKQEFKKMPIISCNDKQIDELAKNLEIDPSPFISIDPFKKQFSILSLYNYLFDILRVNIYKVKKYRAIQKSKILIIKTLINNKYYLGFLLFFFLLFFSVYYFNQVVPIQYLKEAEKLEFMSQKLYDIIGLERAKTVLSSKLENKLQKLWNEIVICKKNLGIELPSKDQEMLLQNPKIALQILNKNFHEIYSLMGLQWEE